MKKKRIAIALSGGVDSATAAACLLDQGYEVIGLTMQLWNTTQSRKSGSRTCCATEDLYDARRVAQTLDIPFFVVNLESEFRQAVVTNFMNSYALGQTPNPCIVCNQVLKFEHLLKKAQALKAECLATGHYAIQKEHKGHPQLWRGKDPKKDQSYFLFTTKKDQLTYLRFPLGEITKQETRSLAQRFNLHLSHKAESQDLCFIPDGDRAAFITREGGQGLKPGPILDVNGTVLGEHQGLAIYTIGQRKGLGISSNHPLYVVSIQPEKNQLIVGPETSLMRDTLTLSKVNWLLEEPFTHPLRIEARIRYSAIAQPATLTPLPNQGARVQFDTHQRAITPGQACVFYSQDRVLGGGWIQ